MHQDGPKVRRSGRLRPAGLWAVVGLLVLGLGLALAAGDPEPIVGTDLADAGAAGPKAKAPPAAPTTDAPTATAAAPAPAARVAAVVDGDTLRLEDGTRVRLVQIDAPELAERECYAAEARAALARVLPPGTPVRLEHDDRLDRVDRYGRRLAYVFKGRENVNRTLVVRGAASVWFFGRVEGRYARELDGAAQRARQAGRGLWGACPATVYDPFAAVETRGPAPAPPSPPAAPATPAAGCDPNYEGACVPPYDRVGDVDCADVGARVRVVGADPHGLDGRDDDGWGCERYG